MTNVHKYIWDNFAPFGVGLDDMFSQLETMSTKTINYPPYNILKRDTSNYEIEIALAGFKQEEIEVSSESNILKVTSKITEKDTSIEYLHKGLSKRSFCHSWHLADDVRIRDVEFNNGLLVISLEKIIPEHQKKTVYEIGGSTPKKLELLTE